MDDLVIGDSKFVSDFQDALHPKETTLMDNIETLIAARNVARANAAYAAHAAHAANVIYCQAANALDDAIAKSAIATERADTLNRRQARTIS